MIILKKCVLVWMGVVIIAIVVKSRPFISGGDHNIDRHEKLLTSSGPAKFVEELADVVPRIMGTTFAGLDKVNPVLGTARSALDDTIQSVIELIKTIKCKDCPD